MNSPVIAKVEDPSAISVVAALAHETWNRHFVPIVGQEQVDHMLDKFQSVASIAGQIAAGYFYYTIAMDNLKVGYFALAPVLPGSGEAQLSKIYVMTGQQGRGLGKCMLAFAEALCGGMGVRKLWLTVNRQNAGAIAFYERMGFRSEGVIVQDIGGGFVMDDYRMAKPVENKSSRQMHTQP